MFFKKLAAIVLAIFAAYCYFLGFVDVTIKIFGDNGGLGIVAIISALVVFGAVGKFWFEKFGINDDEE